MTYRKFIDFIKEEENLKIKLIDGETVRLAVWRRNLKCMGVIDMEMNACEITLVYLKKKGVKHDNRKVIKTWQFREMEKGRYDKALLQ